MRDPAEDDVQPDYRFDPTRRAVPPLIRYGVTLARLEEQDIELLRYWRNRPWIRDVMVYRQYITAEEQRAWFRSIDNELNFYSIIIYQGLAVGATHTKSVDPATMVGEGGMLIWDEEHQKSIVPFLAATSGTDWMFFEYGLKRINGRVLRANTRALRYNRAIGYVFDREEDGVLYGYLDPANYSAKVDPIRHLLIPKP